MLDPNELEPKGHVAIDWFVPSPDGKLVAVCLSEYGSEEGTLHFYHTETGLALPDRIPRVQYPTGGGSAAWEPDAWGSSTPATRIRTIVRPRISGSINRSTAIAWARRIRPTNMRLGATFRGSPAPF